MFGARSASKVASLCNVGLKGLDNSTCQSHLRDAKNPSGVIHVAVCKIISSGFSSNNNAISSPSIFPLISHSHKPTGTPL